MTLTSDKATVKMTGGFIFCQRTALFSCHHVQTGCGDHPSSYPMDIGGKFPDVKLSRRSSR
jgi:hypothetical protein